jgi:hypothetical protein
MANIYNPRREWLTNVALKWESDKCLLWPFRVDKDGYGRLNCIPNIETRSHRAVFFLKHGRWPEPNALHSCDTPGCCNLRHISEGTPQQNQHEKAERGRSLRGVQQHDAKLTDDLVRQARAEYVPRKMGFHRLAKKYGVSKHGMMLAIKGASWKHV